MAVAPFRSFCTLLPLILQRRRAGPLDFIHAEYTGRRRRGGVGWWMVAATLNFRMCLTPEQEVIVGLGLWKFRSVTFLEEAVTPGTSERKVITCAPEGVARLVE